MVIVRRKIAFFFSVIFFLALTVNSVHSQSNSADTVISYLPRNEDMQTVAKDYNVSNKLTLEEMTLAECEDKFSDVYACFTCAFLREDCPNCCLTPNKKSIKCTEEENSTKYYCAAADKVPPVSANCPRIENCPDYLCPSSACQYKGCAGYGEDTGPTQHLEPVGNCQLIGTKIYCQDDGLMPKYPACASNLAICKGLNNPQDYYSITEEQKPAICPPDGCNNKCPGQSGPFTYPCYLYNAKLAFTACSNQCKQSADNWDQCQSDVLCCQGGVCNLKGAGGFTKWCSRQDCDKRIAMQQECRDIEMQTCTGGLMKAIDCVINGNCQKCFKEIDPGFNYRFVAKSGTSLTIIWQVDGTPLNLPADVQIPKYFFTQVRVFDVTNPAADKVEVYKSPVNEKDLSASFSIFGATHINKYKIDTTIPILEQGKVYEVGLYYYFPYIEGVPNMQMDISRLQLVVMTTRE